MSQWQSPCASDPVQDYSDRRSRPWYVQCAGRAGGGLFQKVPYDLLQILIVSFQLDHRKIRPEQTPLPPPPRGFTRAIGEGVVVELRTHVHGRLVRERILLQQRGH